MLKERLLAFESVSNCSITSFHEDLIVYEDKIFCNPFPIPNRSSSWQLGYNSVKECEASLKKRLSLRFRISLDRAEDVIHVKMRDARYAGKCS